MDILKLVLIVIVSAIIIVYLQSVNKEFAMIATIFAGGLVLISVFDIIAQVFNFYHYIASIGGISDDYVRIIAKVTLICYIIEFAAGIVEDFGLKSLADKLIVAGKIIIALMAVPIVTSLMQLIESLVT